MTAHFYSLLPGCGLLLQQLLASRKPLLALALFVWLLRSRLLNHTKDKPVRACTGTSLSLMHTLFCQDMIAHRAESAQVPLRSA